MKDRLIIGITGASGVIYGIRLLEILNDIPTIETSLILSSSAQKNIGIETEYSVEQVKQLADVVYDENNHAAAIASGSYITKGMIVIPCTIKTLSAIANSYNDNLLVRAADVTLKESRKLVVIPRETPLHKGHLKLLLQLADIGGIIIPPIPAFYHQPKHITDIIDQTIGKILDQFDIQHNLFKRWSNIGDPDL